MVFHQIDRETDFLLPPSIQEWLQKAHFARYVVDVVEQLDLSALERAYAGKGSDDYHPATLLALLLWLRHRGPSPVARLSGCPMTR